MFKNVILVCIMPDLDHLKKSLVSQPNNRTFSNNYNRNATNKMCPPLPKSARKIAFCSSIVHSSKSKSLLFSQRFWSWFGHFHNSRPPKPIHTVLNIQRKMAKPESLIQGKKQPTNLVLSVEFTNFWNLIVSFDELSIKQIKCMDSRF